MLNDIFQTYSFVLDHRNHNALFNTILLNRNMKIDRSSVYIVQVSRILND